MNIWNNVFDIEKYKQDGGFNFDYLNSLSFDEIYELAIKIKWETSIRYVNFISFLSQKYNLWLINFNKIKFSVKCNKKMVIEYEDKIFIINKETKPIEHKVPHYISVEEFNEIFNPKK